MVESTGLQEPHGPVEILAALQACPTAPFHEAYVAAQIVAFCRAFGLHVTNDSYGNLLVRAAAPGEQTRGRPIAFCAHMDHPALEVTGTAPLTGIQLGGVRAPWFARPVPVRFITPTGEVPGRILSRVEREGMGHFALEAAGEVPAGSFGVFDVGPFREEGHLLYGPAMDDLAGCAAILWALAECRRRGTGANAFGVFTRAEETGLIGATLVARQRLLPEDTVVVSLEASRELPDATMGNGPVIRVGDRTTAFHPEGEALLRHAATRLLSRRPDALVQRQLMSGGTCEATAFTVAGYCATGVAFPLGNYHNQGPDEVISPEYIHRQDLITGAELLFAAAEQSLRAGEPDPIQVRLDERAGEASDRLRETFATWKL